MTEYYIHDRTRGYVGNSMVWWKDNDCGYVCDIQQAKVWTQEQAEKTCAGADDLEMWPKPYIDSRVQHHIDMQTVSRKELEDW